MHHFIHIQYGRLLANHGGMKKYVSLKVNPDALSEYSNARGCSVIKKPSETLPPHIDRCCIVTQPLDGKNQISAAKGNSKHTWSVINLLMCARRAKAITMPFTADEYYDQLSRKLI